MKLWLISQTVNNGWDTYSDAVVAAETEEDARCIHPAGPPYTVTIEEEECYGCWAEFDDIAARHIGDAVEGTEAGVICASYHSG